MAVRTALVFRWGIGPTSLISNRYAHLRGSRDAQSAEPVKGVASNDRVGLSQARRTDAGHFT
jgi:hypothetical protein